MKSYLLFTILIAFLSVFLYWLLFPLPHYPLKNISGKKVLITGASQGIGRALVDEYAKLGASDITIVSRSNTRLEKVKLEIKDLYPNISIHILAADLSTDDVCRYVVETSIKLMNGLDLLILNHITSSRYGTWLEDTPKLAEGYSFIPEMFAVNTWSYIWMATYAMDTLKSSGGSIGVVSSLAASVGTPKTALYSSTKHALNGFFNALRAELKLLGVNNVSITICSIGATDTEGAALVKPHMSSDITWDPPSLAASMLY